MSAVKKYPTGLTGSGSLALIALLSQMGATKKELGMLSAIGACLTGLVSYISTHGGLRGIYKRILDGTPE